MKHMICIRHPSAIFTIPSTKEEIENNEYNYGFQLVGSHLVECNGQGCKLTTVDFQKARDYDGS